MIIIEVKASVLTATSKYGFDPASFESELHRKAITGGDGERKGVAQLHHSLQRWLDGDDIVGVDRKRISMIYPILLFLDRTFTGPYLHEVYNEHFDRTSLQRKPKRTIAQLVALSTTDLENCLPLHPRAHACGDSRLPLSIRA